MSPSVTSSERSPLGSVPPHPGYHICLFREAGRRSAHSGLLHPPVSPPLVSSVSVLRPAAPPAPSTRQGDQISAEEVNGECAPDTGLRQSPRQSKSPPEQVCTLRTKGERNREPRRTHTRSLAPSSSPRAQRAPAVHSASPLVVPLPEPTRPRTAWPSSASRAGQGARPGSPWSSSAQSSGPPAPGPPGTPPPRLPAGERAAPGPVEGGEGPTLQPGLRLFPRPRALPAARDARLPGALSRVTALRVSFFDLKWSYNRPPRATVPREKSILPRPLH